MVLKVLNLPRRVDGVIVSLSLSGSCDSYLFLAVLQHVLKLGQLLVLLAFDPLGLIAEMIGVLLFKSLDGLFLLPLHILHLCIVLTLLHLRDEKKEQASVTATLIKYAVISHCKENESSEFVQ